MAATADDTPAGRAAAPLERFADLVRLTLGVPTATVAVGAASIGALDRLVVAHSAPLVLADRRADRRAAGASADPGVIAFAGFPLTDSRGAVVGALAAIDDRPREWSAADVAIMTALAEACSAEVVLGEQRRRVDALEAARAGSAARARSLLLMSESLAATRTVADVRAALERVAAAELAGAHTQLWLPGQRDDPPSAGLDEAVDTGRRVLVRRSEDDSSPLLVAHLPLHVAGFTVGGLTLRWSPDDTSTPATAIDSAMLRAIATYTAQACQRALLLQDRISAALTLQQAMLTPLPEPDHLHLVAHYVAAAQEDQVGGDWYDALVDADGSTTIVIGDVSGHDIHAAALMGQLRNLLRGFLWEHPHDPPSATLRRLDTAIAQLRIGAIATVFVGRIEQDEQARAGGLRTLRWTSAGHPRPILIAADGSADLLRPDGERAGADGPLWSSDLLLGARPGTTRTDHLSTIAPGATLVLYTDGLVEAPDSGLDEGIERLLVSARANHGRQTQDLLRQLVADLVGDRPADDVATLAVRFNPEDRPRPAEAGPRTV